MHEQAQAIMRLKESVDELVETLKRTNGTLIAQKDASERIANQLEDFANDGGLNVWTKSAE